MTAGHQNGESGATAGIYLRPERRSVVQFEITFLDGNCPKKAATALEKALGRLYARHGEKNVEWYIERSLGLDVARNVAWCNVDITDQIVL